MTIQTLFQNYYINQNNSLVFLANDLSAHRKITNPSYGTIYLTSKIPVLKLARDCPEFRYFSEDIPLAGDVHSIGVSSEFHETFFNIEGNLWFIHVLAGSRAQYMQIRLCLHLFFGKIMQLASSLHLRIPVSSHVLQSSREFSTSFVITNKFTTHNHNPRGGWMLHSSR